MAQTYVYGRLSKNQKKKKTKQLRNVIFSTHCHFIFWSYLTFTFCLLFIFVNIHIDTHSVKNLGHVFIIKLPQKVFILYIASVCIPVFTLEKNILRRLKIKTTFVVFYNFSSEGGGYKNFIKKQTYWGEGVWSKRTWANRGREGVENRANFDERTFWMAPLYYRMIIQCHLGFEINISRLFYFRHPY